MNLDEQNNFDAETEFNDLSLEVAKVETLDDLPTDDDEQVKVGGYGGGVLLNHNETIEEVGRPQETETEKSGDMSVDVADLPVDEEAATEIKSGGPGYGGGGILLNHNETTVEDADDADDADVSLDDLSATEDEQVIGGRMLNIKHPDLVR